MLSHGRNSRATQAGKAWAHQDRNMRMEELTMNTYKAFYKGRNIELQAATSYLAQCKAAQEFKVPPKKQYNVTVMLLAVDGREITHVAVD
jgi:hypothetical protein